jgi:hypothetical protein
LADTLSCALLDHDSCEGLTMVMFCNVVLKWHNLVK